MSWENCKVLVVGAGLTGLSAAAHLRDHEYRLIEKEDQVGGLCRSIRENGYTFDYTGHLLHLRRPEIREWIISLLGEESFLKIDRISSIYSHGVFTDYPFQVNTHGLPKSVVRECVMGFAETLQNPQLFEHNPNFKEWILATFGTGIASNFMIPYNQKLFRAPLETLSADWVEWAIPKPTWKDVVQGAIGTNTKTFGYNPQFLYPRGGGIDLLPRAILPYVRDPMLGTGLESVDLTRREARLTNGETIRYERMISTLPLPNLLRRITNTDTAPHEAPDSLRHVSVLNLNLGFDAPSSLPYHWVYFPESRFPFYRVGIYSNLCPRSVPEGSSSFYVEVSYPPDDMPDRRILVEQCVELLREVGFVPPGASLQKTCAINIPVAYVIHDSARRANLAELHRNLEAHGILSTGRYGAWEYSAMEDALWQGRQAARWAE